MAASTSTVWYAPSIVITTRRRVSSRWKWLVIRRFYPSRRLRAAHFRRRRPPKSPFLLPLLMLRATMDSHLKNQTEVLTSQLVVLGHLVADRAERAPARHPKALLQPDLGDLPSSAFAPGQVDAGVPMDVMRAIAYGDLGSAILALIAAVFLRYRWRGAIGAATTAPGGL